jgi:hypothetical protein
MGYLYATGCSVNPSGLARGIGRRASAERPWPPHPDLVHACEHARPEIIVQCADMLFSAAAGRPGRGTAQPVPGRELAGSWTGLMGVQVGCKGDWYRFGMPPEGASEVPSVAAGGVAGDPQPRQRVT